MFYRICDHLVDRIPHVFTIQDSPALFIDDLSLFVIYLVIFQQVLTDTVVVALDLLLGFFNGAGKHFVLDLLIFRHTQRLEHVH